MKKLYTLLARYIVLGAFMAANNGIAGILDPSPVETEQEINSTAYKWINSAYVGYGWPMRPGLVNPDEAKFHKVGPGDTDDIAMTGASYSGILLGKQVSTWLTLGISYDIYNNFNYQGYHTNGVSAVDGSQINFMRSFSITHQSMLFNFYLHFPKSSKKMVGKIGITPILGGGLGIGINNMSSFQTFTFTGNPVETKLTTLALINTKSSLAGYFNLGVGFSPEGTPANFGIGYRCYYGGTFSSGNKYTINDSHEAELLILPPWTGKLKVNQIKIFLDFDF